MITSITAEATGFAYSSGYSYGTGVYGREGMTYDETLAPGSTYLVAQARNSSYAGAYTSSSLSFTPSLTELAFFTSVTTSFVPGLPYSSAEISAALQFNVNFTLTEATTVSLSLDRFTDSYYQGDYIGYAQETVTLAQLSGSDPALLYSRTSTPNAPDAPGIFYAATLLPGDYLFTINSNASDKGNAFANGALQFSPSLSPVPEPAGALLIALGLATFLRRRRAAD
jgi:hypothetical protein